MTGKYPSNEMSCDPDIWHAHSSWSYLNQVRRSRAKVRVRALKTENEVDKTSYNTVAESRPELETVNKYQLKRSVQPRVSLFSIFQKGLNNDVTTRTTVMMPEKQSENQMW